MPKYLVRLESPDLMRDDGTPHYRLTSLVADSEDEARRLCEAKEHKIAAHRYQADDIAQLEQIEADAADRKEKVPAMVRMQLATHRQTSPYEVVSVEEAS